MPLGKTTIWKLNSTKFLNAADQKTASDKTEAVF